MEEIILEIGSFWENETDVNIAIDQINSYIENNKDKKIVISLPFTYFDDTLFDKIINLNMIEFQSRDGRRFKPSDILLTNNKFKGFLGCINNSDLSQFEKFVVIYSFVTNYKKYKLSDEMYWDIGRSPYLFLDDDYINCVGICHFLCILCRKAGINIAIYADEEKDHAICYFYIRDDIYGIDGYFSTDPTADNVIDENDGCSYTSMIGRILFNNDFEKFLNGNRTLSYPNDNIDIGLFYKYASFLKTSDFLIEDSDNKPYFLHSFRNKFQSKKNYIDYDIIYSVILKLLEHGYISKLNDGDIIKYTLFVKQLKEKAIAGEPIDGFIKSFGGSSTDKTK